ncbi:ATP-binding protein [Sunxiuqinia sp. sy24]|uniref:ATP-binding protein n=1 Tax=Sunxiuqinia sp. sy24 TaxID=3461495 RepID=UPI0040465BD1
MKKRLSIPSHLTYLYDVEKFIHSFLQEAGLPGTQLGCIVLTTCESVNNAISHGNRHNINKLVDIRVEFTNNVICIEIEDEGDGFDVHDIPDPTDTENIRNERGRGIFIIRNLADDVEFENNGALIKIKFKLSREHQLLL